MSQARIFTNPRPQYFTNTGAVAAGYKLFFYSAGTTTKKDTYTDSTLNTANPNPIILDSAGRPDNSGSPIDLWLDGTYKVVLAPSTDTDPPANSIWTVDNYTTTITLYDVDNKAASYTVLATDDRKTLTIDATATNRTVTLLPAATAGDGFTITIMKSDSSTNTVTIDGDGSETINGATTKVLYKQYEAVTLISNGTAWLLVSKAHDFISFDGTDYVIDGSTKIDPSGNLTLTSGNLVLTSGNATLTDGNLTVSDGTVSITDEDSRTATVDDVLTLTSTTDGTPAAGIGTGLLVRAESEDEAPSDFGRLAFSATDVATGTEDTDFVIQTRTAGAALSNAYKMRVTDTSNYIITGAPSAERTITLPNTNFSIGGFEFVSTTTASAASEIEFTDLSATTVYKIIIENVTAGTDTATLNMTVSNDNGSSYLSTGYQYTNISAGPNSDTVFGSVRSASASSMTLTVGLNSGSDAFICGELSFRDNGDNFLSFWTLAFEQDTGTVELGHTRGSGRCVDSTGVTAVKLAMNSGTLSGTVHLLKFVGG